MDCPAEGCKRDIEMTQFACAYHWRILSRALKLRVMARWNGRSSESYDDLVAAANVRWDGTAARRVRSRKP